MCVSGWSYGFRGNGLWEKVGCMCAYGTGTSQLAARSALIDFCDVTLVISVGSIFQIRTARMLKTWAGTVILLVELIGVAA